MITYEVVAELAAATKRYGATVALDGLDLQVRRGELLALLGPNGAGKTTAISLLLGLQQPDSGVVRVFGESPQELRVRRKVGVMMQEVTLAPELRVREHLVLVSSYYPFPLAPESVWELTNTSALANKSYAKLSGGQKRQAQFALAVCGRPQLLFLDEPTAGLDVQARETMWTALRRLVADGCSIVLTTHYLEEAEALADRVVVLAKGSVVASGSVNDLRAAVAGTQIRCSTFVEAEEVRRWPGVAEAKRDGRRLHIAAISAEPVVRRLLAADSALSDLEVQRASLAEAFTELTQEVAQ